jgi:tetratricopeptide (TPR) repeat protein
METALKTAGQPVNWGTMAHEHDVYLMLTDNATQQYDLNALRQYAPLAEGLATRDGHQLYLAIAHRAWGVAHRLAGEYVEAEARLNQAMELFVELQTHWQIGRTLFEMAELDLARSDQAGAREHFSRAIEAFETMKAMPDVARTQAALEALG